MNETRAKLSWLRVPVALAALVLLLPVSAAAQADGDPGEYIIGVGMAYDNEDVIGPATIAYLYEEFNMGIIDDGDIILEYRGFPVNSGAELHQLILDLPDVAIGEPVDMLLLKDDGAIVPAAPVAAPIAPKVHEFTFPDRVCVEGNGCLCSKTKKGSTCIRTVTIEHDATGKVVSTTATCADGVNSCSPPPKKGK